MFAEDWDFFNSLEDSHQSEYMKNSMAEVQQLLVEFELPHLIPIFEGKLTKTKLVLFFF